MEYAPDTHSAGGQMNRIQFLIVGTNCILKQFAIIRPILAVAMAGLANAVNHYFSVVNAWNSLAYIHGCM